jgi:hypothetical protein
VLIYPYCSELFNHGARTRRPRYGVSLAENQELASILLCPADTSTFSASVVEKLRAAWVNKHRRGPSTPRHKRCVTQSICEALRSG